MKIHGNARTCPKSHKLLVGGIEEEGCSLIAAAEAAGISEQTASPNDAPPAKLGRRPVHRPD